MEKEQWIDHSIVIDFKVSHDIQNLMDECERLELEQNWGYPNYAEALDCACKEAYATKRMSKSQWETVERKYLSLW